VIDLDADTVDAINRLIREGRYRTVQDFLFTASQNQLYDIENTHNPVVIRDSLSASASTDQIVRSTAPDLDLSPLLTAPDANKLQTTSPPKSEEVASEIYGLYNRFFPIKITVRVLASMLKGNGPNVPLSTLQENASSIAREYGRKLLKKEIGLGRRRSEMIATALPTKSKRSIDEFKSKARFKSHFVGYVSKERMEGAPAALRFVNIHKGDNGRDVIGLTAAGLEFAKLTNPVIENGDLNSPLSDKEREFLVNHIFVQLPEEAKLMRSVLKLIKEGATNPEKVQGELGKLKPKLKETELSTVRSGLLSRMSELSLITRERVGLSVRYHITSPGEELLKRNS
jgi:hypothetical protein